MDLSKLTAGREPPHDIKHTGATALLRRGFTIFQRNSGALGQQFPRFAKIDVFDFLDKGVDVAHFATGPTTVTLTAWVHVEGRSMIVMKGTQALVGRADRSEADIRADEIDDVDGLFDLLRQGFLVGHQGCTTGLQGPKEGEPRKRGPHPDARTGPAAWTATRNGQTQDIVEAELKISRGPPLRGGRGVGLAQV